MRAALITGREQVELREFPRPEPPDGGVVVDVALCGVCGTDVHAYQSGRPYNPAVCGHEWTGTISAVGADVRRFSEGDRVIVGVPPACGRCGACRAGQLENCSTTFAFQTGRDALAPPHGGFAPHLAVARERVILADPALSDVEAAQIEPATVTYHAVRRSGLRLGDTAVVQGGGPIGLTTLQWARIGGAAEVIVIEPNPARRALAEALGATLTVAPDEASEVVLERTGGLGADHVFECVGRAETIQSAVDLARRGGSMCLIGLADKPATIQPGVWLVKEIKVTSALAYLHDEFVSVMGLVADGRMRLTEMHTDTVDLDGFEATLAELAGGTSAATKVLVDPR